MKLRMITGKLSGDGLRLFTFTNWYNNIAELTGFESVGEKVLLADYTLILQLIIFFTQGVNFLLQKLNVFPLFK